MMETGTRARLKEDSLRFWLAVSEKKPEAVFHMHKGTAVHGILTGTDAVGAHCNVSSLKTPIGTYPLTTLRTSDIDSIQIRIQLE
ncbi:hypothetical protein HDU80_008516 [Chytriomyces hyalinus]|nr:hypothetical protein HDU80_008516 [Chytriomyces hyalinus]